MKRPKYMNKVWFWDDERTNGDGIFITLKYGWCFEPLQHVLSFDTPKEAREAIKAAYPCNCKECRENKGDKK